MVGCIIDVGRDSETEIPVDNVAALIGNVTTFR
jgi:hypothetical protein